MKALIPDRFSVIRILSQNDHSNTFVASDHLLERSDVIVKILRKGHFTRDRDHLIQKLSWFAGIRHANVGVICDAGLTKKGDLYYVREYLPPSELFSVDHLSATKALVSAVDLLHLNGRIHGAIKPSNIFLHNGCLKLTDPSVKIAGHRHGEEDIRFSAPEVLRGESATLESDLYSVGAVLYRVITRRNLFEDLNLTHLQAKHIWASPVPIGNRSDVPKEVSDALMRLLDKDPRRRRVAFESLKERIGAEVTIATRAPFIGRAALLKEVLDFLCRQSAKGLRVLMLEGGPGIGKTRLIDELRIRCGFEGVLFLTSCCLTNSADFDPVLQTVREILRNVKNSRQNPDADLNRFSNTVSEYFRTDREPERTYSVHKVTSELVGLLVSFARQTPMVLAIDDVDKADFATLRLIEQLSFRAAEAPLTLVLTHRPGRSDLKLNAILNDALGNEFVRRRILPLTRTESLDLVPFFLERSFEQHSDLLQTSGGNPLFLEAYSTSCSSHARISSRVNEALSWMTSQITKETKPLAETLALLRRPVDLETMAKISGQTILALQQQLSTFHNIGLLERNETAIRIAYPDLATLTHKAIPRAKRLDLAKRAFEVLRTATCEPADLAYYSFEAGMFREAGTLYQQLANAAYAGQKYQTAISLYQRLQECELRGGFPFSPQEKLNLARCYGLTGMQRRSRGVCEDLLSKDAVCENPELLSETYAWLANVYDKTSGEERIRLSRLAIDCLPRLSAQLVLRYATLCSRLMEVGDLSAAADALEKARKCAVRNRKDSTLLNMVHGALLMNMGNFRAATQSMLTRDNRQSVGVAVVPVLNNVALCFENLGDLRKALRFQSQAQKLAIENGILPLRILSLNNLGSIKTKLGDLRAAEQLFGQAFVSLQELRKREAAFDMARFVAVHCDAASHSLQMGKYQRAADYLKNVQPSAGSVYEVDRVSCGIVQCYFYLAIGSAKTVRALLTRLHESQSFRMPFFQVEQTLLDARMPDVSSEAKLRRLQDALEITHQLGTLYQQGQVLNELAAVLISTDEKRKALEYTKSVLRLAKRQGYKLLSARALLLAGIASEKHHGKEHKLLAAFHNASAMGLLELVAESAFHLGMLHLESGNPVTAHEHLVRSLSITDSLADEIPHRFRGNYLAMPYRRDARKELEQCRLTIRKQTPYAIPGGADGLGEDRFFKATYRFALSGAAINSAEALLSLIEEALRTSLARGAVIVFKDSNGMITRAVRIKVSQEVIQRIHRIAAMAKNRIYFGSAEMSRQKETVAWIPLQSETREGGIYVVCRQNEPPLTEKEMELLAIIGTIGNGTLRGLETQHTTDLENNQLAEFHGMIGASKAIRDVYSQIQIAARNAATVLIEGESGTGKELVAKAIHAAGPRAKEHFIPVDCGAIPEGLIEAELFGVKKGSFTGAVADRAGLFEAAHRGTIFLDEISNTTPSLQAKLLRVSQEREVRRIGETKDRPIDIRLIVASNTSLEALAAEGRFRRDLLYRLNVLHIKLPPLRGRRDDIPMLANGFLLKLNVANKSKKYFAPGVISHLAKQNFPGNVRELQNAIERAFFSAKGSAIFEVPLETGSKTAADQDEVQSWFKDLSEGRRDFWSAVHNRYKRRDIAREKVLALVDLGLQSTRGSYKTLASRFHLKDRDYRRFMDFLRRNGCLLDFRPYRKAATDAE